MPHTPSPRRKTTSGSSTWRRRTAGKNTTPPAACRAETPSPSSPAPFSIPWRKKIKSTTLFMGSSFPIRPGIRYLQFPLQGTPKICFSINYRTGKTCFYLFYPRGTEKNIFRGSLHKKTGRGRRAPIKKPARKPGGFIAYWSGIPSRKKRFVYQPPRSCSIVLAFMLA